MIEDDAIRADIARVELEDELAADRAVDHPVLDAVHLMANDISSEAAAVASFVIVLWTTWLITTSRPSLKSVKAVHPPRGR